MFNISNKETKEKYNLQTDIKQHPAAEYKVKCSHYQYSKNVKMSAHSELSFNITLFYIIRFLHWWTAQGWTLTVNP